MGKVGGDGSLETWQQKTRFVYSGRRREGIQARAGVGFGTQASCVGLALHSNGKKVNFKSNLRPICTLQLCPEEDHRMCGLNLGNREQQHSRGPVT